MGAVDQQINATPLVGIELLAQKRPGVLRELAMGEQYIKFIDEHFWLPGTPHQMINIQVHLSISAGFAMSQQLLLHNPLVDHIEISDARYRIMQLKFWTHQAFLHKGPIGLKSGLIKIKHRG